MIQKTNREILEPHRGRKIRAFWREPDPGNHADTNVFDAFTNELYGAFVDVPHKLALKVERDCATADATVGDMLAGRWPTDALWRKWGFLP